MEDLNLDDAELSIGDKVLITGLESEKGKLLNGEEGYIVQRDDDPFEALMEDGRYKVRIIDVTPMCNGERSKARFKKVAIKRKNLKLLEASMQTKAKAAGKNIIVKGRLDDKSEGLVDAVNNGDHVLAREIMEYLKKTKNMTAASIGLGDCGTPILASVAWGGSFEVAKVLFEYGADSDKLYGPWDPDLSSLDLTIFGLAMLNYVEMKEHSDEQEKIINLMIKNGADINRVSSREGSALNMLCRVDRPALHEGRMRIVRNLLANGADPNIFYNTGPTDKTTLPLFTAIGAVYRGPPEHRSEVIKVLLQHNANPGKIFPFNEMLNMNAIHFCLYKRHSEMLELMLSSSKQGRDSIDDAQQFVKNGTLYTVGSALLLALIDDACRESAELRKIAIILMRYGSRVKNMSMLTDDVRGELELLLDKAPERTNIDKSKIYWNPNKNKEVKAFINRASRIAHKCPVCLLWSDQIYSQGLDFKRCARCETQWYCSKECQKRHWPYHKTFCKKVEEF